MGFEIPELRNLNGGLFAYRLGARRDASSIFKWAWGKEGKINLR
jgi:hypothetical protein